MTTEPKHPISPELLDMFIIRALIVVVVLAIVSAGGLVIAGGGDGVYQGDRMVRISTRRAAVFDALVDPQKRKAWVTGLTRPSTNMPASLAPGTKFSETVTVDGQEQTRQMEITAFQEGQRFGYRTTTPKGSFEIVYDVSAHYTGKRTLLKADFTATWQEPWDVLIEPILSSQLLTSMEAELARLKDAVEGGRF